MSTLSRHTGEVTTHRLIRASLSSVRKELAEVFPRLTDDMLPWAPAEGMRTVQGQFVEIISTEVAIVERLQGVPAGAADERDAPLWALKTVDELIAKLNEVRETTLRFLDGLDEEGLGAPAANISEGFQDWLELKPVPVSELLRFIARHESYHAGQLVSYLWSRGDDPYSW